MNAKAHCTEFLTGREKNFRENRKNFTTESCKKDKGMIDFSAIRGWRPRVSLQLHPHYRRRRERAIALPRKAAKITTRSQHALPDIFRQIFQAPL